MTLVVTANVVGKVRGTPVRLPNRRRRLSTIVARHKPADGRRYVVSVHRGGTDVYQPNDRTVRLRAAWKHTLVGPNDTVLITVVPMGKGFASIGLAIASIALIALAPYAAPALAGAALGLPGAATGTLSFAIQAGMVLGGVGLSIAAQASSAAKTRKEREVYSLTGGGNVPRPGARKPLLYGTCWSAPPLSQKDYIGYDGDTMVLVKRMTLGLGKFQIHQVKVGDALFWTEDGGIQPPFSTTTAGPSGTAIEFLYEQPSSLASGDVVSSDAVAGQQLPRPGGNPEWTPWFRAQPQGVTTDQVQVNWTFPRVERQSSAGRQVPGAAGAVFQARRIDPTTGNPIGEPFDIVRQDEGLVLATTPLRRTALVRWPEQGAYEVRGQNLHPANVNINQVNDVTWDTLMAFEDDIRIRPLTTEVVIRVRAGPGLTITAYSDITVQATRILPVWDGTTWTEQPTRKAVWAYCDLVRASYGLAAPSGVDADKALYYANLLSANDTYDGALPEVSSFWEAAGQILLPMRADAIKVGAVHSFVRDESRAEPRHVLTRRQIVRDSASATYKTKVEGGDVIVEFDRDGDPRRPDEVRYSYGPPSRTPKRYRVAGITDGVHALKHAKWLAAVAVFRGAERAITTEWDGRLVYPGDHILSDLWFLQGKQVYGVASAAGNLLTLDVDANVPTAWGYGSIRTRAGREWGILRMRGQGARGLELHPDDVIAAAAQSGMQLSAVLARDTQDPTTVVLGELVELQETYVARSAIPSDADHVRIEMVRDDARVWQLLDEDVIAPAPVNADSLAEPLVPQISVLHARCYRIETGIEVAWGVSPTRGARTYEVELSYDNGVTWETISPTSPASSGRAPMRQSEQPVTVRARAYGRTGLHGEWVSTTFTTVAPVVQGELIEDFSVSHAKMTAQLQKEIADINAKGQATLALGQVTMDDALAAMKEALALANDHGADANALAESARRIAAEMTRTALQIGQGTQFDAIRQIADAYDRLAAEIATQRTTTYEQRQLTKVQLGRSFAAIERTERASVSRDDALASVQTALSVRLDTAEGGIVGNATAIQGISAQVTSAEGALISQAQSITTLGSRIDANDLSISGQATATQQLTTRVKATEDNITSNSSAITQLQNTVSTQGGLITGQATAIGNLTTSVAANGSAITAVSDRTTVLEGKVTTQGGTITAQGTAIDQLKTDVSANAGSITAVSNRTTALESTVSTQGGQISGNATGLSNLTTRVQAAEGKITSQGESITSLQSTVATQGGQISGTSTALGTLTTRVGTAEGKITSQSEAITALQSTASTQAGQISGNATATSNLTTRVDTAESTISGHTNSLKSQGDTITSQGQAITSLQSSVSTQGGQISGLTSSVSSLTTRTETAEGKITTQGQALTTLQGTVSTQGGQISSTTTAVNNAWVVINSHDGIIVNQGKDISALSSTLSTQGGQISANASAISGLTTRVSNAEGVNSSQADRIGALESTTSTQGGQITTNAQAINSLQTVTSVHDTTILSQAQDISFLSSKANTLDSNITAVATTASNLSTRVYNTEVGLNAVAETTSSLTSTVGGHTSTLTTYGSSINGLQVQWGVTGYIDGQSGGFVFQGIRRLDGAVEYSVRISGSLFVSESIQGWALAGDSIIVRTAQIGTLIVGTSNMQNRAISQIAVELTGQATSQLSVTTRASDSVIKLSALNYGTGGAQNPRSYNPGMLSIYRQNDGTLVARTNNSFAYEGNVVYFGPTPLQTFQVVGAGTWTYLAENTCSVPSAMYFEILVLDK
ncbi:host specificity factor TipJ family phage tail protein [Methylobacterium sp. ID0610]|uniref:host specificity factor TipJ family phage tail protein n=1 Tax=Methylobacterium carpenticola TaxID=3344827 RepID=UPI0036ABBD4F